MTRLTRGLLIPMLLVGLAPQARAEEGDAKPDHSITHQGLTGLFNLVTPDTLDKGQVSFGLLHRNYDREITDIDVGDLAASFGIGVADRFEVGMTFIANRQMDFDAPGSGGFQNSFPYAVHTIDNGGGDLYAGVKYALVRIEERGNGLALYGRVKFPTANEERGRGTGGYDFNVGATGGLVRGQVGFYGSAGFTFVGDAKAVGHNLDLANAINYGFGLELGARSWVKGIAELSGEHFVNEQTTFFDRTGERGQEDSLDLSLGFKLGGAGHSGFTLGGAYVRNLDMAASNVLGHASNPHGWVAELTYTSYDRPVPPPPVEPTPMNHPPTCSVLVTPDEVYPSFSAKTHTATATAQATDPDGDSLSYEWSASGGSVAGSGASVTWNPPPQADEGSFTVTARVTDGKGGDASCSAKVAVKADPEYFDGRVQFEFDRYDLTPDALRVIERAAQHLRRFPSLKLTVEGHACYIATEEYNLQLGQQRAESIRTALATAGVDAGRLATISYGEARPWQDNTREITRRLNRRGEFRFKFSE